MHKLVQIKSILLTNSVALTTHMIVKTFSTHCYPITYSYLYARHVNGGHAVAHLVEALRYKPQGRGCDSRGATGIFHWHNLSGRTMALGSSQSLTEISTSNISWERGVKVAGVGSANSPPSCADCLEIWGPQPPGSLLACNRSVQGLLYLCR